MRLLLLLAPLLFIFSCHQKNEERRKSEVADSIQAVRMDSILNANFKLDGEWTHRVVKSGKVFHFVFRDDSVALGFTLSQFHPYKLEKEFGAPVINIYEKGRYGQDTAFIKIYMAIYSEESVLLSYKGEEMVFTKSRD